MLAQIVDRVLVVADDPIRGGVIQEGPEAAR
jgi:hypothetical protein